MLFSLGYVIIKSELGSEIATPREQFRSLKTEEKLTMSTNLVGDVPSDELGAWVDIFQKRRSGVITAEHVKRFAKMEATPPTSRSARTTLTGARFL